MEPYERAYNSAMDDTDPVLVKKAMEIGKSKMTIEQKTDAIWELFEERRKKKVVKFELTQTSIISIDGRVEGNSRVSELRDKQSGTGKE